MFRTLRQQMTESTIERAGTVISINGNGTYSVNVAGAVYENIPSTSVTFHRPGESVRVAFVDGRPLIIP